MKKCVCMAVAAAVEACGAAKAAYDRCVRQAKSDPCCAESGG